MDLYLWSIIAQFLTFFEHLKIPLHQVDNLEQFGTDCSQTLWLYSTQDIKTNINASPFFKTYFKFISKLILESESM